MGVLEEGDEDETGIDNEKREQVHLRRKMRTLVIRKRWNEMLCSILSLFQCQCN